MKTMTRAELTQKIIDVVCECAPDIDGSTLKEETVINTDTGVDSMGMTLIICRLEAQFNVQIPQRQWKKLYTLGDVIDAFEARID